jgi:hypothetical protein
MTGSDDDAQWIEVVDGKGLLPVQRLGPYANARLAGRAQRSVMRLLNGGRYTATLLSQQELERRDGVRGRHVLTGPAAPATGRSEAIRPSQAASTRSSTSSKPAAPP